MKNYILILGLVLSSLLAFSQTTPVNINRSDDYRTSVDNFLSVVKRLGIPTADRDTLTGTVSGSNSIKIIYNTTLGKLRGYNPVTDEWIDVGGGAGGTLQEVTDAGNITSNALYVTGAGNIDPLRDGLFLGASLSTGQISFQGGGLKYGDIIINSSGISILKPSGEGFTITGETSINAGLYAGSRIEASPAINPGELVTLGQLNDSLSNFSTTTEIPIANSTGVVQFNAGTDFPLRFQGTGDASVSFNPSTRMVTINSVPGSGGGGAVTSFNGRDGAVVAEVGDYSTTQVTEGTNQYFTQARVRTTPLTGYTVGANTAITATDNILQAFQKLQGQINVRAPATRTLQLSAGNGVSISNTNPLDLSQDRSWTIGLTNVGTPGAYTKVTTDAQGRVIAGSQITWTDLPNIGTQKLIGRAATGSGSAQEITLGTGLSLTTGGVLNAQTGETYTAGSGLTLTGTEFSLPVTVSGTGTYVQSVTQNAGGITVALGTPPNTNTTYTAGSGLTLTGTAFSLPVTTTGTGTYVQSVSQTANGIEVTLGTPPNTTYSLMSAAEINTGTSTTARSISAERLNTWLNTKNYLINPGGSTSQYIRGDGSLADFPAPGGTGTVTQVTVGNGLTTNASGGNITSTGNIVLGTPGNITLASTNSVGTSTHTHNFAPGGTTSQYIRGDGTLATFPTIPTNFVTTNTNQTSGLTGNKTWGGAHTFNDNTLTVHKSSGTSSQSFTNPHLKLTASGNPSQGDGIVGITMATSSSDNYGISLAALRGEASGATPTFVVRSHTNSAEGTEILKIHDTGQVTMSGLSGSGTQMVVATSSGALARQPIPAVGVTQVTIGNGLTGSNIVSTGTITLGTPGSLTSTTTNSVTTSSHTHALGDDVWGSTAAALSGNLNDYTVAGHRSQTTAANATLANNYPWEGGGGSLINSGGSGTYRTQIFHDRPGTKIAWRARTSGSTWSTWKEFWHSGNFNPSNYSLTSHTHPWTSLTGSVSTIPGAGSSTTYGSLDISGSKAAYSGINFVDAGNSLFMVNNTSARSGMYKGGWVWAFEGDGTLYAGTVPWANLSGYPNITAGNGLTGGGSLSSTKTITLATPGTLTASSTNAVTASSHTHSITTTTSGAANTIVQTNASGVITASGGNSSQWNQAYGWGNYRSWGLGSITGSTHGWGYTSLSDIAVGDALSTSFIGTGTSNPAGNKAGFTYPFGIHINYSTAIRGDIIMSHGANRLAFRTAGRSFTEVWTEDNFTPSDYTPTARTITLTGGTGITSSAGQQSLAANRTWTISLDQATATVRGGVELFSNTVQSVAANAVTATASRTYGIQLNSAGQAVVNVPWTDANTTYTAGNGLALSGTTFSVGSGTGITVNSSNVALTAITAGNSTVGALRYNSTTRVAGQMYGGTTAPASSTRLNYDGVLHAYDFVGYGVSDSTLKQNIVPIDNALSKISQIGGYSFDWKPGNQNHEGPDYGVIAQEIAKVLPDAVIDRDGVNAIKNGNQLIGLLIEGIKELTERVEALEKENEKK